MNNGDPKNQSLESSPGRGIQPQIFYKGKDDAKVIYEEGQETYRPPAEKY